MPTTTKDNPDILILLSISKEVASVRNKADLFPIIDNTLKKLFNYDDGIICLLNDDQVSHSPFLYNPEEVFKKHPGCEHLAGSKFGVNDGIYDVIVASDQVAVLELEDVIKQPNASAYVPFWIQHGMKQLIGVALRTGSRTLGTFSFYSKTRYSIHPDQFRLLHGICSQIAMAIENILTREEMEKKEREKTLLLSFSNRIATARDIPGLKLIIKQFLKNLFQIKEYIITIRNSDNITYSYFLHDLPVDDPTDEGFRTLTSHKMPVAGSLTEAILKAEEPVTFHIRDIIRERKYSFPAASFWKAAGAESILGVRLKVAEEDIGILWIQGEKAPRRLLEGICAQIAIALANAIANKEIERQFNEIKRYKQQLLAENLYLQEELELSNNHNEIVGAGPEIQKVYQLMSQVAYANSTVLILGETGTGKEMIARAIHNNSPRKDKLMVKVNCAALPVNLIESELFGHEKGSFTGATDRKIGKFELANNSTLFLDEIGEMPPDLQVKLLRAIQEREIERVGGESTIKVNVRILAATNRNLQQEVKEGRFRSDLFYRLNVFPIQMPPLRDRLEDIPLLVAHFIKRLSRSTGKKVTGIADKALQDLMHYSWPGNIRELEHMVEKSLLLTPGNIIRQVRLPSGEKTISVRVNDDLPGKTIEENERDHILATLKRCRGKIFGAGGAAERLGIPPSTLNSKIRRLGIRKEQSFNN